MDASAQRGIREFIRSGGVGIDEQTLKNLHAICHQSFDRLAPQIALNENQEFDDIIYNLLGFHRYTAFIRDNLYIKDLDNQLHFVKQIYPNRFLSLGCNRVVFLHLRSLKLLTDQEKFPATPVCRKCSEYAHTLQKCQQT